MKAKRRFTVTSERDQLCLQRKHRLLVEAKKLNPKEERALAEEGMRGEGSAGGRNEWLESLTRPRN